MSFSAYPSYKHSGVEWLGDVPVDWQVRRLRELISLVNGYPFDAGRFSPDAGLPLIRIRDLNAQEAAVRFDGDVVEAVLVTDKDLLIGMDGDFNVGRWLGEGPALLNQRVCCLRGDPNILRILEHTLPTPLRLINDLTYATTVKHLSSGQVLDIRVALPPSEAGLTSLVEFLERETAKIDALIEEQRRLIALLKEKRQAVISHAVTKGLDPHASMKDSGIEWLGDVPAHWAVSRLKFHLTLLTSGSRGWGDFYADEGPIFVRIGNMTRDTIQLDLTNIQRVAIPEDAEGARTKLQANDLLFSITAYLGSVAIVPKSLGEAYISQHVALCRLSETAPDAKWLGYLALSEVGKTHFDLRAYGGTKIQLSLPDVSTLPVLVPPAAEQDELLAWLDNELGKHLALEAEADAAIVLLIERRAALISAAVTGKIDVRGYTKVLPFSIDRARARGLIATEIIERSAHQSTFGRVKFQKIAFLAEAHVGIDELEGSYTREAAGPLDRTLIDEMESGAHSIAGIEHEQPGGPGTTVSYRLGQQGGTHRKELTDWLGAERTANLDKLIADCAILTTKQAEAVATLYGVWNDALSEGTSPTDDEIISSFLSDWHPEKRAKFRASELPEWLRWMRRHGVVPTGTGPTTTTGRLFA